ncbi:heavy metal translocating P-type ATPase [Roseofilum casamattae]|uniref:Heavy metal translocating P-type ATPase n=1 Tax=Roseofilum casamattae BLCC-M143 TaxID=3022442 RepID=A0ABT7BYG9_9CYAN|nr:heavy metal translocating P-type ATPase [Roseofilum casamattae]MDJ1184248.1 heavy metal translocating P-type ATPase [Roseofilum casamattae BLCC-M143]
MIHQSAPFGKLRYWLRVYPEAIAALTCALLTLMGWLALNQSWLGWGIWMLMAAYVIGGRDSCWEGLKTLWQERELDVDLLMIVAAIGAAILGFWQQQYYFLVDGAVLILIFAASGALESIAMQRTERNIRSLMELTPDTARILQDQQERTIATEVLQIGDRILIKPGEIVPTDGIIYEGRSTLNQAPITGESLPQPKEPGDEVFAGSINGRGALLVEVHKSPQSSLIQRIIQLVEQAKTSQPPSVQSLERFERGYARCIVVIGIALAVLPPFLLNWNWETTIYRALIFLVVASPCALMAAIMPTLLSGIARGARQGILFKDGAQLETMGRVVAIAFDKTGTLTTGELEVSEVIPAPHSSAEEVIRTAASLEAYSEHPLARGILKAAETRGIALLAAMEVAAEVGAGITGSLQGQRVVVGKAKFALAGLANIPPNLDRESQRLEDLGQTAIWVVRGDRILGLFAISDRVRPSAAQLLAALKSMGIQTTVMLTGDNAAAARGVARTVGVDVTYSDLLPEDKVEIIEQLQQQYDTVAMVGDGINDAPALARASLGIAMGGAGSDVALETADVVLMADRLEELVQAIRIGKKARRIIKQNITLALTSVVVLLIANFFNQLTLPAGVLGHEGSTLLVTLNGLRMLR